MDIFADAVYSQGIGTHVVVRTSLMRCYACDHVNSDDVRFCTMCGTLLRHATWVQAPPAPPQQVPFTPPPAGMAGAAPATYAPFATASGPAAAPAYGYGYPPAPQIINNITVAAPASPVVVIQQATNGPNLFVRALWFLFIGLWLGALWSTLAWLLIISVIGLPLGLLMANRLPYVMTLKPPATQLQVTAHNGVVVVSQARLAQHSFALRTLYFLLVGWWASGLWLLVAWILTATWLGLPLAFWMFNRVPAVTTLAR